MDFARGSFDVTDNIFKTTAEYGSGGDGIDISYSSIYIARNTIDGHEDKCISVGERSDPKIEKNLIARCNIGIAVKDSSRAFIVDNTFVENGTAVSLYQKKPEFGGGYAFISGSSFENNKKDVESDDLSTVEYSEN